MIFGIFIIGFVVNEVVNIKKRFRRDAKGMLVRYKGKRYMCLYDKGHVISLSDGLGFVNKKKCKPVILF